MKREIKFRGRDLYHGQMVEGMLHTYGDGAFICQAELMSNQGKDWRVPGIEVDPETVGQLTGLKDKNGVEIYEGDIVRWYRSNGEVESIETVMHSLNWDGRVGQNAPFMSAWGTTCGRYYKTFMNIYDPVRYSEVIGNVHENPDLLP